MTVPLSKPIAPGFMRPFTLTPDQPVGQATTVPVTGDSTITIDPTSTSTTITGFVRGDGSIGTDKAVTISVAQENPADPPVTITITWSVEHADATTLAFAEGATDVPIPPAGKKK